MKETVKFYNGLIHNRDAARPVLGITCFKANKDWKYNANTEYTLINIIVNGGNFDSYVLKNNKTGKVSNSIRIVYPITVSITDWNAKIKAAIEDGNGVIDFKALRRELENSGINTITHALALYNHAITGDIKSGIELINYMITDEFTGKMLGMLGIGTSVKLNPFCKLNQLCENAICKDCYAENMRKSVAYKLALCTYVLCTYEFTPEQIPLLNCLQFRFESFSDLMNDTQAKNYLNISAKNPHIKKAIWTKRPEILYRNIINHCSGVKPEKLSVVVSSMKLNTPDTTIKGKYMLPGNIDMVNHVFTVFTASYALANNIIIKCGNSVCLKCGVCYNENTEFYVNEILKDEQSDYYKTITKKERNEKHVNNY